MCNQKISVCIYAALVSQESNSWLFTWTGEDLFFKPLLEQLGLSTRASKVTWPEIKQGRMRLQYHPSFFQCFSTCELWKGLKRPWGVTGGLCFTFDLENFYLVLRTSGVFRGRQMSAEEMAFERVLKTLSGASLMAGQWTLPFIVGLR